MATHYSCSSGTLGAYLEYQDQWQWWCMGSGGGTNILCAEIKPTQISTIVPTNKPTIVPTRLPTRVPTATKKPTATRKPTSPVISGERILGDSNGDGVVDVLDYSICYQEMNGQKNSGKLRCDFTGPFGEPDGVVDTFDYSLWYYSFLL